MEDNVGIYLIVNDEVKQSNEIKDFNINSNYVVYEVIRIIDKTPLFFEDHYIRLGNSLNTLGIKQITAEYKLIEQIRLLVNKNQLQNCNVKVIVFDEKGIQNYLLYISRSYYPSLEEVKSGVRVGLMQIERKNPNVKMVNSNYKSESAKKIKESNVFEVLIVNNDGKITEGSKSNVFFLKDSKVYTTPGEYVLKGITRQYIIDTCKKLGLEVIEELIGIDNLNQIDGLFISGTSIKVLPVSEVDKHKYSSAINPAIIAIRDGYDKVINEYIQKHKL